MPKYEGEGEPLHEFTVGDKKPPFVIVDNDHFGSECPMLVCGATVTQHYRAVYESIAHSNAFGRLVMQERLIYPGAIGPGKRYTVSQKFPLQSVKDRFKKTITSRGGSPEAIDALHDILRFSAKELKEIKEVADKLAKKTAPAKADAKVTKTKTTAADKAPAKGKGNPEALAKAREAGAASREAARARKIKALVKPKDVLGREGSFRRAMLEDVLKAKTVGEFYDMNPKYDAGCLRFAIENNIVSVA